MKILSIPYSLLVLLGVALVTRAEPDLRLNSAGAPYAPLDVSKKHDPTVPLSTSQRNDLIGEFKGLVHLGLKKASYEQWSGKEMADCENAPSTPHVRWTYRCEIITGQGNGYYYFYPNQGRTASTLQEMDIRVHAADEKLLDDFRRPVQDMFGLASFVEKTTVRSKPVSRIRRWNTETDVVELFIDRSVRPEGSVRLVWMRSTLVSGSHASLPQVPGLE